MLTPGEAPGMRAALEAAAIPTKPLRMNPAKTQAVGPALQALCSKDAELKVLCRWVLRHPHCMPMSDQLCINTFWQCHQQLANRRTSHATAGIHCSTCSEAFTNRTCFARSVCAVDSTIGNYSTTIPAVHP
jgi:hypothetical protein